MTIKKFTKEELEKMKDLTDYERLQTMTEEEIEEAAKSDPDVPHLSEEELKKFKKVKRNRSSVSEKDKD